MNIDAVRVLASKKVKKAGSQMKYAEMVGVSRGKLNEFLNGGIDYVPDAILEDLGLEKCDVQYKRKI